MAAQPEKVAEFNCKGDIVQIILADQLHDFLGAEDARGSKQFNFINFRNRIANMWSNTFGVENSEADFLKYKGASQFQKLSETLIKNFMAPDPNDHNFVPLQRPTSGLEAQKLGIIDLHCLFDVFGGKPVKIHIDAIRSNKNLLMDWRSFHSKLDLLTSYETGGMRAYFEEKKNIYQFTPVLGNLFDMAVFDKAFKYSSTLLNKSSIINIKENYEINGINGSKIKWTLEAFPSFYEIATKTDLRGENLYKDPIYYNHMINDVKWLFNQKLVFLKHGIASGVHMEGVVEETFFEKFILNPNRESIKHYFDNIEFYPHNVIEHGKKKVIYTNDNTGSLKWMSKTGKNILTFIKENLTDERAKVLQAQVIIFLTNFVIRDGNQTIQIQDEEVNSLAYINRPRKAYVSYCVYKYKNKMLDITTKILNIQKSLNFEPSVRNIVDLVYTHNLGGEDLFNCLLCKSLGDLSVITSSFYDETVINYMSSMDKTAIFEACTLSRVTNINTFPINQYLLFNTVQGGINEFSVFHTNNIQSCPFDESFLDTINAAKLLDEFRTTTSTVNVLEQDLETLKEEKEELEVQLHTIVDNCTALENYAKQRGNNVDEKFCGRYLLEPQDLHALADVSASQSHQYNR